MAATQIRLSEFARQCGMAALDAVTFGVMSRAAQREQLEIKMRLVFPDDWQLLLETMGRFDCASLSITSPYVMQMWAHGKCQAEEVLALWSRCPAAFRHHSPFAVIGQKANSILPELAKCLP